MPLCAVSIFTFNAFFIPVNDVHAKNMTYTFAPYVSTDRADMMWFCFNGCAGGLRLHFICWGLMLHFKWGMRGALKGAFWAMFIFFALFNGIIGIVSAVQSGGVHFWSVIVPAAFLSFIVAATTDAIFHFKYSVHVAFRTGFIEAFLVFAGNGVVLLFMIANLQMENETVRAIISGIVYPGAEVCIKYIYRKAALSNRDSGDTLRPEEKEANAQAFIYISRNMEMVLFKPNIYLIFLLQSQKVFMATLAMSSVCEICGLFISNLRFTKTGQMVKRKLSKAKVAVTVATSSGSQMRSWCENENENIIKGIKRNSQSSGMVKKLQRRCSF